MSMIPSDDAFDADSLRALGGTVPSAKSTSVGKVGKFGARSWLEAQDAGMSLIPGMGRTPSWSETTTAAFARIVADARSGELEPDWREIRAGAASGRLHHARAREGSGAGGGTPMSPWAYPFTCQAETEVLALREVVEGGPWDWEPGASGGPDQALRAWWISCSEIIDFEESSKLHEEQQRRGMGQRHLACTVLGIESEAKIRERALIRRDLLTESVEAAIAALSVRSPELLDVFGERWMRYAGREDLRQTDWAEKAIARTRRWADADHQQRAAHLARLNDSAYRAEMQRIPDYWMNHGQKGQ